MLNERKRTGLTIKIIPLILLLILTLSAVGGAQEAGGSSPAAAKFNEVYALYKAERYTEAEKAFRIFAQEYPEDPLTARAYYILGRIEFRALSRYKEALADFQRLVDQFPGSSLCDDAYYNMGFIHQYIYEDTEEALRLYRLGYYRYPNGDYRYSLADKITELSGAPPAKQSGAATGSIELAVETVSGETIPVRVPVGAAPSAGREAEPEPMVTLDFQDADIRSFIKVVSELTGKNFIIDDNVQGNITVISPREVPLSRVYDVFLSILEVKGYTVEPAGSVTKVVPRQSAAQGNVPVVKSGAEGYYAGDEVITRIVRLHYTTAATMQSVVQPLLSPYDSLVVHAESNSLIITGPVNSINRVESVIRDLDEEGSQLKVEVYSLEHAVVNSVAETLRQIVAGFVMPPGKENRTKIMTDSRTNNLIVLADDSFQRVIENMVERLDVDETKTTLTKTFALEYAEAEKVQSQLESLVAAKEGVESSIGLRLTRILADKRLNVIHVSTPSSSVMKVVEDFIKEADQTRGATRASLHVYALQNAKAKELAETLSTLYAASTSEGGTGFASEGIAIVAEDQSNSLLITSTPEDYTVIEGVIASLDVKRPQVLVEAFVAEVTLETIEQLGVELSTLDAPVSGSTRVLGGTNYGLRGLLASGQASGMVVGVFRGSQIGPVINALEKSSGVNILSKPTILATDNSEASIVVGDLVPVATTYSDINFQAQGTTVPAVQIEYRNVGVELTITPHVNEDSYVTLDLSQDVQTIRSAPIPNSSLQLPAFTQRSASTRVTVRDGDVIAIGGLISTNQTEEVNKVPLLGDIPLLGLLFRNQKNQVVKTNLLIFITPRIVTDYQEARAATEERQQLYDKAVEETYPEEDPNSLKNILP